MYSLVTHRVFIYIVAGFISILISSWVSLNISIINPDAICYLQSAESMRQGLSYAMHLCDQAKWPFYSMIIAGLVNVTHLSYITAATILNGFFSFITVLTFIRIVVHLGEMRPQGPRALPWLAMIVILLANTFNDVKHYIIRDHGFWAFYLLSVVYLLCFIKERYFRYAIAFSLSILAASLFRIEGVVFLLTIPFVIFLLPQEKMVNRTKVFLKLNMITILLAIVLGIILIAQPPKSLGRLDELTWQHAILFASVFQEKAATLATYVLSIHAVGEAKVVLFFTLVVWYFYSVITNLTVLYSVLVIYALCKKCLITDKSNRIILWSYVIVNIFITGLFLAENMFLSKRYLLALSLMLMLWVPFALESLIVQWRLKKVLLGLLFILMVASSLSGVLNFGYSKQYIRDAGDWVSQNVPKDANVYVNDLQVMYYSHHFGDQIFSKAKEFSHPVNKWLKYNYIILRVNKKDAKNAAEKWKVVKLTPIQVFSNKRGDEVRIYRTH